LFACLTFAAVAACVSNAPPSLSAAQVASLRLERVNVTIAPDANINWSGGEMEFAKSRGVVAPVLTAADRDSQATSPAIGEYQERHRALANTPEARSFVRNRAAELVREGVTQSLAGQFTGQQPMRIDIVVRGVQVNNPLLRVLVDNNDVLTADATVVDAASGRALASYPGLQVTRQNSFGLVGAVLDSAVRSDSVHEMARVYGQRLRAWLLPS
jgi:hypothetical protein